VSISFLKSVNDKGCHNLQENPENYLMFNGGLFMYTR